MSSSEERSIPDAAPLGGQLSRFFVKLNDLREVVDHDWDWRGVHDLFEEAKNSLSVASHCECKVSCSLVTSSGPETRRHTWANDDRVSGSSLGGLLGELDSGSSGST
jgi:hypothetical protein